MRIYSHKAACCVGVLLLGVHIASARDIERVNGHDVAAKQAILRIDTAKSTAPVALITQQLAALGDADDFRPLSPSLNLYVLHSKSRNVAALLQALQAHPAVAFVEPDYLVAPVVTPNDADFPQQWDLSNAATPGADIAATSAWAVSTGSAANVIGVVDTGIDFTHPDLAANVWSAPAAFTVSLSWGQLTCPAGSHGYNGIAHSCNPADDNLHGTHVSGTIGAIGNNGAGVAGVNWTARMMGLKFMDSTGNGSVSEAIDAIEFGLQAKTIFGAGANLRVLSNSWGGSGFSQALLNEINRANTADVLFVVAAGNSAANDDTTATYPASFSAPNLIAVAATTNTDALASFSNYGPSTVHLGAPGVNILSTLPGNSYGFLSGTSMAAPHVAGAALLVLSKCSLNTAGLKNALLANVDPAPGLQGKTVTGGRLNVNSAIRSCAAAPATGTAAFLKTDTANSGNWKSAYGADGYNVLGDSAAYPGYAAVTPGGQQFWTWTSSTTDARALQKASAADRAAATWYSSGTFTIDVNLTDGRTHQVALYCLDWDYLGRAQTVTVLNSAGAALDTRGISGFSNGAYLVWNISGHVTFQVTLTGGRNAAVSGIFFGGAPASTASAAAAFVQADWTSMGNWKGPYGGWGYNVLGDSAAYPPFASVTPGGQQFWTWAGSATDARALQKPSANDRVAATWYSAGTFTVDVNLTDGNTHQVALYCLDWDYLSRAQTINVLNSAGTVLDSRSISGFTGGVYLVWNITGHVTLQITRSGGPNAVLSGLFFDY